MYRQGRISRHVVFALIPLVLIALNVAYAEFAEDPPVYLRQWAVPSPSGAAFDSLGNIYIVDRSHKLVKKSDYYGVPVTEWASCGASNLSQCTVPYDIAFDSIGNMYVIDTNGIAKFDKDAKLLRRFGVQGSFGSGIAVHSSVDSFGNPFTNIYVTNSLSHSVQKFSSDGTLLTQWGQYGMAVGQFRYPYDVAIDSEGNVYVADSYNWRIQKFDSNGKFLTQWPSVYASGLAIDDSDNIYVISWSRCSIQKFTPEGILLTQWGSCGNGEGKFMSPFRINISPAGEIYVSDTGNNRIQVFGPVSIDEDGDGIPDTNDNCSKDFNPGQEDEDLDGIGDACDACPYDAENDIDSDAVCGNIDNCPQTSNPNQSDTDGDGKGDVCDVCPHDANNDMDRDNICGDIDNCLLISNPDQSDADNDGKGDACDICPYDALNDADTDGVCGDIDNCPQIANPDQADVDTDDIGDVCDPCNNRPIAGIISPSKDVLWPPDHRMVPVTVKTSSLVIHNPDAKIWISSVTIMERDKQGRNIYSKNSFEPDFEITGALSRNLRSERTGNALERTYIITVTAQDCSGPYNFTTEVTVPHDKGK